MAFTSARAHEVALHRQIVALEKRVAELEKVIQMHVQTEMKLRERVRELEAELSVEGPSERTQPFCYPMLSALIDCLVLNSQRLPEGRRYSNMKDFFALLSFMGPHYFDILHTQVLFPSYRTTLIYRTDILTDLCIDDCAFNGDIAYIQRILGLMLPEGYKGKMILMIDAAYVTPYVKIDSSGKVTGLIHPHNCRPEIAQEMIEDPERFERFMILHQDEITNAEFGMMLAPTDPSLSPIPICAIPANSGTATLKQLATIETIILQLQGLGYDIAGLATDGDRLYKRYSEAFVDAIIQDLPALCGCTASELVLKYEGLFHFSDPYHLVKRDRYRKIGGKLFTATPNSIGDVWSRSDLEHLGVPPYLLDNDSARRMEDSLPLKMFSKEILDLVINAEDLELVFCMLPSTLLMESLHSEKLSRQDRIDFLMFGASLVILYYLVQIDFLKDESPSRANGIKIVRDHYCFSKSWCKEYISVVVSIINLLSTEDNLHLGSCGTHFLEHFFGAIRRHSRGEDTHQRFVGAMRDVLLERILLQRLNIPLAPPQRRSDSGVRIVGTQDLDNHPFGEYLYKAKLFMNNFIRFPDDPFFVSIAPQDETEGLALIIAIFEPIQEKRQFQISTKSEKMTSTGGLSNARRWKARTQIKQCLSTLSN